MTKPVDVQIYDDLIPKEFREQVWTYINNQKWYATWKANYPYMSEYIPAEQKNFMEMDHRIMSLRFPTIWMHRTCFGSDDYTLKRDHPIIWKLWSMINEHLDNKYTISGPWEDMACHPADNQNWMPPQPLDPNLEHGWRVYTNGQPDETIKRSHGVHKDTIDESDDTTRTILYVANLEWYPSWFGEVIFYPDDPEGITGDHQQFQKPSWAASQSKNFNIGWLDDGKIVSPVPGRIIDYDGRTLHTTRPTSVWAKNLRITIAFRVRKK